MTDETQGQSAQLPVMGLAAGLVLLGGLALYVATLAPTVVFGDPAEYTVAPNQWGILHPPGYAFMTLLVRLWQTVAPVGSVAWRTNLLAAVIGASGATLAAGSAGLLARRAWGREARAVGLVMAGVSVLATPDVWQHSIHANAHIVTATLAMLSIFWLLLWRHQEEDRWLWAFCVTAGVGVTQHPLTVFGFPAYTAFIISVRPKILTEWRTLLLMVGFGVLGLFSWLYFPLRTAIGAPPFGPDNLHTWEGFTSLVFARGLRVNLFAFGLDEQWHRLIVFASLIRLQYALPLLALALGGLVWLIRRDWRGGLLISLHLVVNLGFTLNTVQDVMAYLLVPILVIGVLIGIGAAALAHWLFNGWESFMLPRDLFAAFLLLLLVWPVLQIADLFGKVSLRDYTAAADYMAAVVEHFEGRGENAVLLADWEHSTVYWYFRDVEGLALDEADVAHTLVIGTSPTLWIDYIWANIERGPIYLNEYRPDVVNTGFRLQAEGPFYRVMPPPAELGRPVPQPVTAQAGPIEWLGYDLQVDGPVAPGARIPLVLYFRAPDGTDDIIQPYATLGDWRMEWTTDSHWLSPWWEPGEVIAERWEVLAPLTAPEGGYPLRVGLRNLTAGGEALVWSNGAEMIEIGTVNVRGEPLARPRLTEGLQANFGNRVGVAAVTAQVGWPVVGNGWRADAPWDNPPTVRPGESIEIRVSWVGLAAPEDSLTVFVHLNDAGNAVRASRDYTPLGGAFPTQLWFPKWLPGQRTVDPYRITAPADLPPGDYYLELGLYGLRSIQRTPNVDGGGNLAGDRFVLGWIRVTP